MQQKSPLIRYMPISHMYPFILNQLSVFSGKNSWCISYPKRCSPYNNLDYWEKIGVKMNGWLFWTDPCILNLLPNQYILFSRVHYHSVAVQDCWLSPSHSCNIGETLVSLKMIELHALIVVAVLWLLFFFCIVSLSWAAFVLKHPLVASAVFGATKPWQLREVVNACKVNLTEDILTEIDEVHAMYPNPCPWSIDIRFYW